MKSFLGSTAGRILITVVLGILIFGGIYLAIVSEFMPVAAVAMVLCGFFGWKALNSITPGVFLWMSFMGWVIYFVVKAFLSVIIGVFVAPFVIARTISNAIATA